MNRKLFLFIALLACFALPLGHLAAQDSTPALAAPNYPWGDPFPIGPAADDKSGLAAAIDAAGNMVVGWTSYLPDPVGDNRTNLYAQRLDSTGAPLGGPFRINENTDQQEGMGGLAMDAAGNFVTVWGNYPGLGLYGRCFAAGGTPRGGDFLLDNDHEGYSYNGLDVAMADDGRFVVAWSETYYQNGNFRGQVHARLFSTACQPLNDPILVNNIDTGDELYPAVAMDAAGNFIVAWVGQDNHWQGVFARLFNRDGAPQGGQFRVNQRQRFGQREVDVAMDVSGIATVVWVSEVGRTADGFNEDVRLWVVDTGYDGGRVFAVSPYYRDTTTLWLETALTWNNAPPINTSGPSLGHLGINPPLKQWVEVT